MIIHAADNWFVLWMDHNENTPLYSMDRVVAWGFNDDNDESIGYAFTTLHTDSGSVLVDAYELRDKSRIVHGDDVCSTHSEPWKQIYQHLQGQDVAAQDRAAAAIAMALPVSAEKP